MLQMNRNRISTYDSGKKDAKLSHWLIRIFGTGLVLPTYFVFLKCRAAFLLLLGTTVTSWFCKEINRHYAESYVRNTFNLFPWKYDDVTISPSSPSLKTEPNLYFEQQEYK